MTSQIASSQGDSGLPSKTLAGSWITGSHFCNLRNRGSVWKSVYAFSLRSFFPILLFISSLSWTTSADVATLRCWMSHISRLLMELPWASWRCWDQLGRVGWERKAIVKEMLWIDVRICQNSKLKKKAHHLAAFREIDSGWPWPPKKRVILHFVSYSRCTFTAFHDISMGERYGKSPLLGFGSVGAKSPFPTGHGWASMKIRLQKLAKGIAVKLRSTFCWIMLWFLDAWHFMSTICPTIWS